MSKITKVIARQVYDSRGNPTIEAEVFANNMRARAICPSGASTGSHEAYEKRDISNKKYLNTDHQFVLDNLPINIFKLVEMINIEFLKLHFNSQSEVKVDNYTIDLNSREMLKNNTSLKLTEKEINTIIYLSKSKIPVSIDELQEKVWSYQSDIESHTVETHIYRLRKKILNTFDDNGFILSKKNGYQIK